MASPVQNVVIVGAGGNLGSAVLKEFLASPLNVTVLSRTESTSTFSAGAKVIKSDYTHDSLVAAFTGADAIVSIVGSLAVSAQRPLIDAAIAAKVPRFIPSEYGSNTSNPAVVQAVPILAGKREIVEYLISRESQISWSALITGFFFDWGLALGFLGIDIKGKTARIWDDGTTRFSATTLPSIGKALVGLLSKPDAYAASENAYVFVDSYQTTQAEILDAAEAAVGAEFAVSERVDSAQRRKDVGAQLAKGDFSSVTDLLLAVALGKPTPWGRWEASWNTLLGLQSRPLEEEVNAVVESVIKG